MSILKKRSRPTPIQAPHDLGAAEAAVHAADLATAREICRFAAGRCRCAETGARYCPSLESLVAFIRQQHDLAHATLARLRIDPASITSRNE